VGREPIPEGRLENLFPDGSNSSREDKPLKSIQLVAQSDKPPSGRSRRFTNLQSMKAVGSERFKHKTLAEINEEIDGGQDIDDGESHDEI
jgi:hypothetical protein